VLRAHGLWGGGRISASCRSQKNYTRNPGFVNKNRKISQTDTSFACRTATSVTTQISFPCWRIPLKCAHRWRTHGFHRANLWCFSGRREWFPRTFVFVDRGCSRRPHNSHALSSPRGESSTRERIKLHAMPQSICGRAAAPGSPRYLWRRRWTALGWIRRGVISKYDVRRIPWVKVNP
jgi:hypothetical protein